jgi:hypothetical protein
LAMVCDHGANKNIDLSILQTRLQAQAAGVNYQQQVACAMELPTFTKVAVDGRCLAACTRNINVGVAPVCPPLGASQYKGTWDVVYKIARRVFSGSGQASILPLRWQYQLHMHP